MNSFRQASSRLLSGQPDRSLKRLHLISEHDLPEGAFDNSFSQSRFRHDIAERSEAASNNKISLRSVLEASERVSAAWPVAMSFFQQNLGLFPNELEVDYAISSARFPLYKGHDRQASLEEVARFLLEEQPDVVAFSEFWVVKERHWLRSRVGHIYPYFVDGPSNSNPESFEVNEDSAGGTEELAGFLADLTAVFGNDFGKFRMFDGGLVLLSRHPVLATHGMNYRHAVGEDVFATKGVLHARISVSGQSPPHDVYDVFVSHMQSCPPEMLAGIYIGDQDANDCISKRQIHQDRYLSGFIKAFSSPGRPAVLLGDLNRDGQSDSQPTSAALAQMMKTLGMPYDVGRRAAYFYPDGTSTKGTTVSSSRSFEKDSPAVDVNDRAREAGQRLDYFLAWPGPSDPGVLYPLYAEARVIRLQVRLGDGTPVDLSDHYGVWVRMEAVRKWSIPDRRISAVKARLAQVYALRETVGPTDSGSDESSFTLFVVTGAAEQKSYSTGTAEDLDTGETRVFKRLSDLPEVEQKVHSALFGPETQSVLFPEPLTLADPGDSLVCRVTASEHDRSIFGEPEPTALVSNEALALSREVLMRIQGRGPILFAHPVLEGGGGEYLPFVEIEVT